MIVFPEIIIKIQLATAIFLSCSFKSRNCFVMQGQHQKIAPMNAQGQIYVKNWFAAVIKQGIYKAFSHFAVALLFRTSWGKGYKTGVFSFCLWSSSYLEERSLQCVCSYS